MQKKKKLPLATSNAMRSMLKIKKVDAEQKWSSENMTRQKSGKQKNESETTYRSSIKPFGMSTLCRYGSICLGMKKVSSGYPSNESGICSGCKAIKAN